MSKLHWNERSFQEATYIRHRTGLEEPVHYTFRVEIDPGDKAVLIISRSTASSQDEKEIFSCLCDDGFQALLMAGVLCDSTLVQED